jgi:hypothetical protein
MQVTWKTTYTPDRQDNLLCGVVKYGDSMCPLPEEPTSEQQRA